MTTTFTALANTTLTSAASQVTFGSIPFYRRYYVVADNLVAVTTAAALRVFFNNTTGISLASFRAWGTGSAVSSDIINLGYIETGITTSTATTGRASWQADIVANGHSVGVNSFLSRPNGRAEFAYSNLNDGVTINAITFQLPGSNFAVGTSFSLYGII